MEEQMTLSKFVLAVTAVLLVAGIPDVWAQKHQIAYKNLGENTKYVQQHAIDVGDIPGHQVRINEIHYTYPADSPVFENVKVVDQWNRGYSDYVDINGRHWGYVVFFLENGDKIFARNEGSSQTAVNADGTKKSTATGVTLLTGGTAKFRGIQGVLRYVTNFDPKAGLNEGHTEGEYWIEK
jgi:hypothetical protein